MRVFPFHRTYAAQIVILAFSLLLVVAIEARAQLVSMVDEQTPVIQSLVSNVDQLIEDIPERASDDNKLIEAGTRFSNLAVSLLDASKPLSERISEINTRLNQLGSAPGEGEPAEAEAIAEERQALTDEKAIINGLIGQAEAAYLKANKAQDDVIELRRTLFFDTLSRRVALGEVLGPETRAEAVDIAKIFVGKLSSWFSFSWRFKSGQMIAATVLALLVALFLSFLTRRAFRPLTTIDTSIEEPSYLARLSVAFWSTLLPTLSAGIFAGLFYWLFDLFGVLRQDIAQVLKVCMQFALLVFFVYRLALAFLNPKRQKWRLIGVTTSAAHWLFLIAVATSLVFGLDIVIASITSQFDASYNLTVTFSLVASLLVGLFVLLVAFAKPFAGEDGRAIGWPRLSFWIMFSLGFVTLLAAMIGYVSFARFLTQQLIVTGAILLAMYIGFLTATAVGESEAFGETALGRYFSSHFGIKSATLDSYGLFIGFFIHGLVLCLGLPLVLLQWGFQVTDIQSLGRTLFTDLQVGSVSISLAAIALAVVVFFLAFWFSRVFQRWLDRKVLARSRMDVGVRTSIRTAVGYLGIGVAGLVAVSVSGFNLSNLAIVAGALSLGIGFGLQNIVSNFVSGLILLAERPFKEGDWVETQSVSGFVKKISVRATEIETFQRQTMIVPNSELINSTVGNWTHRNRLARIEIAVGVAYHSDPEQVKSLLMELVDENDQILQFPEPSVAFKDFGASSLDFEVRFFLADVFEKIDIETDMRIAIFKRFNKEGIEFPFPQRDVNLKVSDPIFVKTTD